MPPIWAPRHPCGAKFNLADELAGGASAYSVSSRSTASRSNQSLKRLRGQVQSVAPEPMDHRTPETEALRGEMALAVAGAIAELPETQREVLLLAHYEQLPLAEIAEITQIEVAAVKSRLQRARATLRETLAAYAPRTERTV